MSALLELPIVVVPTLSERKAEGLAHLIAHLSKHHSAAPPLELLIEWSATLPGAAKFVFTADRHVALQAELPVDEERGAPDADLAGLTAAGINLGRSLWEGSTAARGIAALPDPLAAPGSLIDVCAASGWRITRRDSGEFTTELGTPEAPTLGRLLPHTSGLLLFVELADMAGASAESRAAVATCLLLAGGGIRFARPVMRMDSERATAGFEVLLPANPSPSLLAEALSALAVCALEIGQEVKELLLEPIAREYLKATAV